MLATLIAVLSAVSVFLGFRTEKRGRQKFHENLKEVKQIWGSNINYHTPSITYLTLTTVERTNKKTGKPFKVKKLISRDIKIRSSNIHAKIDKDIREKGLQYYNGFKVYRLPKK